MKLILKRYVILFCFTLTFSSTLLATVIPYPLIGPISGQFSVNVNGTPVPVNIWDDIHYVHFAFSGNANIEIKNLLPQRINQYKISPKKYNIQGNVAGDALTFTLTQPQYLVVDIDPADWVSPVLTTYPGKHKVAPTKWLFILAESLEVDPPQLGAPGVFNAKSNGVSSALTSASQYPGGGTAYFPKGTYNLSTQNVPGNLTIYLEPGAFVKSGSHRPFVIENKDNVTIMGRGHIEAHGTVMEPYKLNNFTIKDVIMRQTRNEMWAFVPRYLNDAHISGIKILTPRAFARDGMDPDNCYDVTIEDCLVYAGDDAICIKAGNDRRGYTHIPQTPIGSERFIIRNNILMTGYTGMKYGYEVDGGVPISDFLWENNTVINAYRGIMLQSYTGSPFTNIDFNNNRIEHIFGEKFMEVVMDKNLDLTVNDLVVDEVRDLEVKGNASSPTSVKINFVNLKVAGQDILSLSDLTNLGAQATVTNAVVTFTKGSTAVKSATADQAMASSKFGAYPNPFRSHSKVFFTHPGITFNKGNVKIYDLKGSLVESINVNNQKLGQRAVWETPNVPSGAYLAKFKAGRHLITKEIIAIK